jgi:lysyl endopeptidase
MQGKVLAVWFSAMALMCTTALFAQERLNTTTATAQWASISTEKLPHFSLKKTLKEDRLKPGNRFAAPLIVDLGFENAGSWEKSPEGQNVWRAKIQSKAALGLMLLFDDFFIPPGAILKVYHADGQLMNTFNGLDNQSNGKFLIGLVRGETAQLEYIEPVEAFGQGRLHLFRVDHAYHQENLRAANFDVAGKLSDELGFGASDPCNININCTEGAGFETERRGICRIVVVVKEGTGVCTGNLMNNTKQDGRPLLLTAFHCQDGYTPVYDLWRFDFNYESKSCDNPGKEPQWQTILGAKLLAGRQMSDFLLLELANSIPQSFKAYFLGWDHQREAPTSASFIHHPLGDIKKISVDQDPLIINPSAISWNNKVITPANFHLKMGIDKGSFKVGSSGSALLNQKKRVVGQLHGGLDTCVNPIGYFGRLFISWDGSDLANGRLKDWLDPGDSQIDTLNGIENPVKGGSTISGSVKNEKGTGVANVRVQLIGTGGLTITTLTDDLGNYSIDNIPLGETYEIGAGKADVYENGLSTLDMIRVQKHILNLETLASPYQIIAADVNNSGTISTLDLIQMRKVILNLETKFASPVWLFVPSAKNFQDAKDPFKGLISGAYTISSLSASSLTFNLVGIKFGDINSSVDASY